MSLLGVGNFCYWVHVHIIPLQAACSGDVNGFHHLINISLAWKHPLTNLVNRRCAISQTNQSTASEISLDDVLSRPYLHTQDDDIQRLRNDGNSKEHMGKTDCTSYGKCHILLLWLVEMRSQKSRTSLMRGGEWLYDDFFPSLTSSVVFQAFGRVGMRPRTSPTTLEFDLSRYCCW